ncbi:MAG: 30S ribosomal protein S8 [bacterium]
MATTDPIADFLTRIRNANQAMKEYVEAPHSKIKLAIAKILREEGYIKHYKKLKADNKDVIRIYLKYGPNKERVISGLTRVSRPGLRRYRGYKEIPVVLGGLGLMIVSTSRGILTARECRRARIGGEVLCSIW